jgi:putative DNA primase/helicase
MAKTGKMPKAPTREPSGRWQNLLVMVQAKSGEYPKSCGANVGIILCHQEAWKGVLAFDEFAGCVMFRKEPQWCAEDRIGKQVGTPWGDDDAVRLANWLARSTFALSVTPGTVQEVVSVVAKKNSFHPIQEWLEKLRWDNKRRVDDWLVRIAGAADNAVNRAISAKFLIAAVARVYEPGCKVDTVPIFEGLQGVGKSTLLRMLCPDEEWFLETSIELGNKDSFQLLRGKWIIELAELDSLNRSDLSRAKAYITAQKDTYRKSYGRVTENFPRRCAFAATTNADEYLKDDTGGRRFWPIKVSRVDIKALRAEREQLWAEAVARYKKKERWHLIDKALIAEFEKEQEARRQLDPWEPLIGRYLKLGLDVERFGEEHHFSPPGRSVRMEDILTGPLGIDTSRITRAEHMRVSAILRKLGWERRRVYIGTEHAGYEYVRPPKPAPETGKPAQVIKLAEKRGADRPTSTKVGTRNPQAAEDE